MPLSVEDIVNQALRAIGVKRRIADIFEGSPPARAALEIYSQTRDELMQEQDWPFAMRSATLVVAAGLAVQWPWIAEYAYPVDALRICYVRPPGSGEPDYDPQPVQFTPYNDTRGASPVQTILCSLPAVPVPPVAIYVGRVTNPAQWQSDFADAFIARLAAKLALTVTSSLDIAKEGVNLAEFTRDRAARVDDVTPPALPRGNSLMRTQQGRGN